jgi:hypothetical protein
MMAVLVDVRLVWMKEKEKDGNRVKESSREKHDVFEGRPIRRPVKGL